MIGKTLSKAIVKGRAGDAELVGLCNLIEEKAQKIAKNLDLKGIMNQNISYKSCSYLNKMKRLRQINPNPTSRLIHRLFPEIHSLISMVLAPRVWTQRVIVRNGAMMMRL